MAVNTLAFFAFDMNRDMLIHSDSQVKSTYAFTFVTKRHSSSFDHASSSLSLDKFTFSSSTPSFSSLLPSFSSSLPENPSKSISYPLSLSPESSPNRFLYSSLLIYAMAARHFPQRQHVCKFQKLTLPHRGS